MENDRSYLKVLQAAYGDSILIRYFGSDGNFHNVIIDGGLKRTYHRYLKNEIKEIMARGEVIDLLVITHIDADHLNGIIAMIEDSTLDHSIIRHFWFNSGRTISKFFGDAHEKSRDVSLSFEKEKISYSQAFALEDWLEKRNIQNRDPIIAGQISTLFGAKITVLSPTVNILNKLNAQWSEERSQHEGHISERKNDYIKKIEDFDPSIIEESGTLANQSSIGFIFEYKNKKLLFTGDALSSTICKSLKLIGYNETNKIYIDYLKLSHHGSRANNNYLLFSIVNCTNFIISSDGSKNLPNKETFARLILMHDKIENLNLFFNYKNQTLQSIFSNKELKSYPFIKIHYIADSPIYLD